MRPINLLLLVWLFSGCSVVREEPVLPVEAGLSGVWSGKVAWIEVELNLQARDGTLTGTGFITGNPVEGIWESNDLSFLLSTQSNASVFGTWTAPWGSGSVGGILGYPAVGMTLRRATQGPAARFDGRFSEDGYALAGLLMAEGDTTVVELRHRGALPVVDIEVTGTVDGDRVVLQLGTSFAFAGDTSDGALQGVIEAYNVASYRLVLNQPPVR